LWKSELKIPLSYGINVPWMNVMRNFSLFLLLLYKKLCQYEASFYISKKKKKKGSDFAILINFT